MAGRPRTMAKRVAELYETYCAVAKELEELMPKQYQKPTRDSLGRTWQTAVRSLGAVNDYFMDLASLLESKAERAAARADTAKTAASLRSDMDESPAPISGDPGV